MAIEIIDQADPPALPSQLPAESLVLAQNLRPGQMDQATHENVKAYRRAADYIAAGKYYKSRRTPTMT
jgi:hypothetical protein